MLSGLLLQYVGADMWHSAVYKKRWNLQNNPNPVPGFSIHIKSLAITGHGAVHLCQRHFSIVQAASCMQAVVCFGEGKREWAGEVKGKRGWIWALSFMFWEYLRRQVRSWQETEQSMCLWWQQSQGGFNNLTNLRDLRTSIVLVRLDTTLLCLLNFGSLTSG